MRELSGLLLSVISGSLLLIYSLEELKEKKSFLNKLTDHITNSEIKTLYDKIYDEEVLIADKYRNWALGIFLIIGTTLILDLLRK